MRCLRVALIPLLAAASPALAEEITTYAGKWSLTVDGFRQAGGKWVVATEQRAIPLEDVVHIRYRDQLLDAALPQVVVILTNGDRLAGHVRGGSALGLSILNPSFIHDGVKKVDVRLERIQAIVFPHHIPTDHTVETMADRIRRREGRRDEIILRAGSETEGIIQKFGISSLEVSTERLGVLTIPYDKVSAVRVFEETEAPKESGFRATVCLTDGSRVTGSLGAGDQREIVLDSPFLGELRIPKAKVLFIYFRGGRSVYLSDLEPEKVEATPFFPREFPWRPYLNRDASYGGGPITIGGVVYPKGLGCHSKVEATYDLGGSYTKLEGIVGIDDEAAGGQGNVIFRVLLDGQEVFSSGEVSHDDGPRPVRVKVEGAKKMTLVVDYGKNIHIQDRADWGDLRLIRGHNTD